MARTSSTKTNGCCECASLNLVARRKGTVLAAVPMRKQSEICLPRLEGGRAKRKKEKRNKEKRKKEKKEKLRKGERRYCTARKTSTVRLCGTQRSDVCYLVQRPPRVEAPDR